MNEDREDPDIMHRTAFGVSGNSETVQQLAGDQFRNRFASASTVCLNEKKTASFSLCFAAGFEPVL